MLKADYLAKLLKEGKKEDESDPLVITPTPDIEKLRVSGSASIDLRLGTWFVTLKRSRMAFLRVSDPSPQTQLTKTYYVPFGDEFYLHPRSFILGITLEWLRLPTSLAAYVIGKSSWGRRGLIIATAASVHPGFKGCITLELSNLGEIPIAIRPGMSLCQLCIHKVERTEQDARIEVDKSKFVGNRKPVLGDVKPDDIAKALFNIRGVLS